MIEKNIENTASLDCSEITGSDSAHQTENYNSEMYIEPISETSIINETNEYDNNLNNTSNVVPNEIFKNVNEKPKKGGNKERLLQEIRQGREERLKMIKEIKQQSENNDPMQIFFKSMASTVSTFPPELAIEAKQKVFNIITELELRALKTKVNTSSSLEPIASTSAMSSTIPVPTLYVEEGSSSSRQTMSSISDISSDKNYGFAYLQYTNDKY